MSELADRRERHRIERDLDATFIVEAAAGTGKTTALVSRILRTIGSGRGRLENVVAVTFTDKASGEMKLRLREEIERARQSSATPAEEQTRFTHALRALEESSIGTIHSFCMERLREWPIEAKVDPLFEIAAEDEEGRLFDRAFEPWFQNALAQPPEGVARILRQPRRWNAATPRELLRSAARTLIRHRDFPTAWKRPPFNREAAIDDLINDMAALGAMATRAERSDDWLAQCLTKIGDFAHDVLRREKVRGRDYDGL